jgi:hypothetical protein
MAWVLTMDLMVQNKVLNCKPKKSKSFLIRGKVGKCELLTLQYFQKAPILLGKSITPSQKW